MSSQILKIILTANLSFKYLEMIELPISHPFILLDM